MPGNSSAKMWLWAAGVIASTVLFANAIDYLTGDRRNARLNEVTLAVGAELLVLSKLAANTKAARVVLEKTLTSGAAAERFDRMVALLGGPKDFVANHETHLARAPIIRPVYADDDGVVTSIRTR